MGININSGKGGTPVRGTVISRNIIREEALDIAIKTPADVDVHLNDILGGVLDNVCLLDVGAGGPCTGTIDATENYWGAYGPWRAASPSAAAGMQLNQRI